jgi:bacterioferritin-associated ferredoxin
VLESIRGPAVPHKVSNLTLHAPKESLKESDGDRIVCQCHSLTESYIRRRIREDNLHTLSEIARVLGAGLGCPTCRYEEGGLRDILDDVWSGPC